MNRLLATVAAATLSLCALAAQAEPFRIVVTTAEVPLVPNSVLHLAETEGYFDRAGIEVKIVAAQQTPMAVAAMLAGDAEMANISLDALLSLRREGTGDLVAVHTSDKSIPFVIVGQQGLDLASLEGKRFGIGRMNSLDQQLSDRVLSALDVDTSALQLVPLGGPAVRAQALVAERIDATTMSIGSFLAIPNHGDFTLLVDNQTFFDTAPLVSKVNVVARETLANREEDLDRVLEALTLAARDFAADPDTWVQAMQRARPDVAPATLEGFAPTYQRSWTVNGGIQREELQYSADRTQWENKRLDGEATGFRVTMDEWVDFTPMDEVLGWLTQSDLGDAVSR